MIKVFFLKRAIIYGFANMLPRAINIILIPIYLTYLSIEQYGLLELSFSIIQLLIVFIGLGMDKSLIRYHKDEEEINLVTNQLIIISFLYLFILLISFLFNYNFLNKYEVLATKNIFIVILITLAYLKALFRYCTTYLRAHKKDNFFLSLNLMFSFLIIVCLSTSIILFEYKIYGIIIINIFIQLIVVLFLLKHLFIIKLNKINKSLMKKVILFSVPMILTMLSWHLIKTGNKLFIISYLSSIDLANYSLSIRIITVLLLFIVSPFQLTIAPHIFSMEKIKDRLLELKKIGAKFYYLFSIIILFISSFIKLLFLILPDSYLDVPFYTLLLLPSVYFNGLYYLPSMFHQIHEKTRNISLVVMSIVSFSIISGYFLIEYFGVIAAIIIMNFTYAFVFFGLLRSNHKIDNSFSLFNKKDTIFGISVMVVYILQLIIFENKYYELKSLLLIIILCIIYFKNFSNSIKISKYWRKS